MSIHTTQSAEETMALGRAVAKRLPQKCVVLLIGNLGAGKTTLAKGLLEGLGVADPDEVTSPTFTLIHEYPSEDRAPQEGNEVKRAYHIDLYRLDTPEEVRGLGLDDLFDQDAIVLIEWGERFRELLPQDALEIRLGSDMSTEAQEGEVHWVELPKGLSLNSPS